jgi:hypothetical protein
MDDPSFLELNDLVWRRLYQQFDYLAWRKVLPRLAGQKPEIYFEINFRVIEMRISRYSWIAVRVFVINTTLSDNR